MSNSNPTFISKNLWLCLENYIFLLSGKTLAHLTLFRIGVKRGEGGEAGAPLPSSTIFLLQLLQK